LLAAACAADSPSTSLELLHGSNGRSAYPNLSRPEQGILQAIHRQLSNRETPEDPTPVLKPKQAQQAATLAALLQTAAAICKPEALPARLERVTLAEDSATLHMSGPGASAAAIRALEYAEAWRKGLTQRLHFAVVTPSTEDLMQLAQVNPKSSTPVRLTIQQALAAATLGLEAALSASQASAVSSPEVAWRAAQRAAQLLAGFRPVLKRRATDEVRSAVAQTVKRLEKAVRCEAVVRDIQTYHDRQVPVTPGQFTSLLEAAAAERDAKREALRRWMSGPALPALFGAVRAVAGNPSLRAKFETATAEVAPSLIASACEHLHHHQASDIVEGGKLGRTVQAVLRLMLMLEVLAPGGPNDPHVSELALDLTRVAECLEAVLQLEAADKAAAAHLDTWAVRQAKRKAPQMHGAEAVLEYRQSRRLERAKLWRALAAAWKPIRGRKLDVRVAALLRAEPLPVRTND
jgi:hypothetical protein